MQFIYAVDHSVLTTGRYHLRMTFGPKSDQMAGILKLMLMQPLTVNAFSMQPLPIVPSLCSINQYTTN